MTSNQTLLILIFLLFANQSTANESVFQDKNLEEYISENSDGIGKISKKNFIQKLRMNNFTNVAKEVVDKMDFSTKMGRLNKSLTIFFGDLDCTSYYSFQQATRLDYYTDEEPIFFNSQDQKLLDTFLPGGVMPDVLLFTRY